MTGRCMWGDGSCPNDADWHCKVLKSDGLHGQSLCDEHADWYMRNNIQDGPFATKICEDTLHIRAVHQMEQPIDFISVQLTVPEKE